MISAKQINQEAIPIDSLEALEIDKDKLSALRNAPLVELEEYVSLSEDGIKEHVWSSRSPFIIND